MKISTTIQTLMKANRVSQTHMARLIGVAGQNNVWRRLTSENMTINTVLDFLDAMDYELVVREKKMGRRREDEIIITREDDGEVIL